MFAISFVFLVLIADYILGFKLVVYGFEYLKKDETLQTLVTVFAMTGFASFFFRVLSKENSFTEIDSKYSEARVTTKNQTTSYAYPCSLIQHSEDMSAIFYNEKIKEIGSKIHEYDEKASALLDKGVLFAVSGIVFFVFSILIWQFTFNGKPMQVHNYIGMASCSFIFIFIEFFAGWCLKQYRSFIDASVYMSKMKAMFERHLFAYLITIGEQESSKSSCVVKCLLAEVSWPDANYSNTPDTHFAKEVLDTSTHLVQAMRSQLLATEGRPKSMPFRSNGNGRR
jgi:hypothetical protein